ncbi:thiol-disulfide isomerase/thioredoxin [Flavobacterium nitrogenifigens]|uniref:Thiol-disulfide isomerase/thioredoxin n=2 Tax=Flavobacterium TaxID=237 RepID=A0A7W7N645_9FLAO|nr:MULTISPECIES: TlpA disulfide reductase family protein [Flavobacterium]MBB4800041.1 thiol-disulfide isomerase/thioredoxin [Flavobacterium nitrogenifigens]MBB6386209.1 thiol-disulfide isomerase/thioredoxin [Flavobacterium notoginsengisoli]
MKKIYLLLFFAVVSNLFSQNGKIYLKNSKFNVGKPNTYVYEPPQGLVIEDNAKANFLYITPYDFSSDISPLKKSGKRYEFTVKVPDSVRVILVTINDSQKIADSNNEKGYTVLLKTQNDVELGKSLINEISVRSNGGYFFRLKSESKREDLIAEYDALFAKYPKLKDDIVSLEYFYTKKSLDKEQGEKDLLAFADKCVKKDTEEYLTSAYYIYSSNNDTQDQAKKLRKEISEKYPANRIDAMDFIRNFFDQPDKTEASVLESLKAYKTKYPNDTSKRSLSYFYSVLVPIYLDKGELEKAIACEPYINLPEDTYNNFAWGQSGGDLTMPVKDIDFATKVSKRSLDIIEAKRKESYTPDYNGKFNMFADTYALLLYKQGKYEEAFKYQSGVKALDGLDAGGKERYLAMLDKVKSKDEVKAYIEDEIGKGNTSPAFIAKLKEIYIEKKLPMAEFDAIQQKTELLAQENKNKDLLEKFGSNNAIDFTLKNLEGKDIKLSDYKGKIVVLDFWATWCGPCKASFPKMQHLVTKYKDKDVAFLFVNTWENGKEEEILKKVSSYITEKKFDFNVVFDLKQEVVGNYKIQAIPTRIVIDKKGDILAYDNSNTDIGKIIEEQLK